MSNTWLDRYNNSTTWHEKCLIMALYHLSKRTEFASNWTITNTAEYFNVSRGLVSENIKLSNAIDGDITITKCKTRQSALDRVKGII